jgi:HD-like signal output (HDOD) protein
VARLFLTEPEIAYLAGLLHPVGMVALDALAPLRPKPHLPWEPSLLEREAHRFGAHNAAIAERVLRLWVLPEDLVAAVGRRYEMPTAETIAKQGHELYLASHVAQCAQVGLPVENGLFPLPEEKLRELGLRKEMFAELELEVAERVTRLQAALEPV